MKNTRTRQTRDSREKLPSLPERDRLLNVVEAAEILCVSPWSIRRWVSRRRIPFVRIGRCVRFRASALQDLVEQNTVYPE